MFVGHYTFDISIIPRSRICSYSMCHSYIFLLIGLLVVTCLQSGVMGNNAKTPKECCFNYYERRIPPNKVDSYTETRSDCPKAGVIFTTKKPLRICVNPQLSWVKKIMQQIDELDF
ncbi:C-C motif chemokine 4 homolog [Myxocyprinus asiaticus]|uniref:C-C motif chemokine 4 homolog n=1 Tax=Myxocyprinus asiaticus TaxID=70543 RepID=UPI0022220FAA|nr:C-C motif chemokine 4 homolog [Myxocyprinus asiaticus]